MLIGSLFCSVEYFIQIDMNSSIIYHKRHVNQNYFEKKVINIIFKLVWCFASVVLEKLIQKNKRQVEVQDVYA